MVNNTPLTEEILQEKALYDIFQYLPVDKVKITEGDSLNSIIQKLEKESDNLDKKSQKAINENLPAIKAVLKDRPELGEARIGNMSWQDNDHDGKPDHPVHGMQACTFEREDQVYISFRGTPRKVWIDNAKGMGPDDLMAEERFDNLMAVGLAWYVDIIQAAAYIDYRNAEKRKKKLALERGEKLNGIFDSELYSYTTPMQEEAIKYMEELKAPADGSTSIFNRNENVYVTGHSKGGNEAVLVTILYSDLIDRCISGNGQGYSPEFVRYIKNTMGVRKFESIRNTKLYGFHGMDDGVNTFGTVVIKEENRVYYKPEIIMEDPLKLVIGNHLPQGMINPETGKLAMITEQGKVGKYFTAIDEKYVKLNQKDRLNAAWTAMTPMQYIYALSLTQHENLTELGVDTSNVIASVPNGSMVLGKIVLETLMEKEGQEMVRWLGEEYPDVPWVKALNRAYDGLNKDDDVEELLAQLLKNVGVTALDIGTEIFENATKGMVEVMELNTAINMGGIYAERYGKFGTISEIGVVAINYKNTKELIQIIDAMDDLVTRKILPEMDDIADSLRGLRYWRVNVRNWTDIRDSIAESNNKRKKLRERLVHYYNTCESMEAKFIERMNSDKAYPINNSFKYDKINTAYKNI